MNHIGVPKTVEARNIKELVDDRSQIGQALQRLESVRKRGIDRDESHSVAFPAKLLAENLRLHFLSADNVEATGDDGDPKASGRLRLRQATMAVAGAMAAATARATAAAMATTPVVMAMAGAVAGRS